MADRRLRNGAVLGVNSSPHLEMASTFLRDKNE